MTVTATTPQTQDAPAFPSDRTCPYQLPDGYARLRDEQGSLRKVTLYDGRLAWVATKHETARKLLADPGSPPTAPTPTSPPPRPVSRASGTGARRSSAWIRRSTRPSGG